MSKKKQKKRRYVTYGVQAGKKPRLTMRFIARWSVVVFMVIATAVTYVWQKNTIISLGYRIHELRREIKAAGDEELKFRASLAKLQRPDRLWEEVNARQLGLHKIRPEQVMRLATPPPLSEPEKKWTIAYYPPAVSETVAKVSVTAPHRESTVLRRRR